MKKWWIGVLALGIGQMGAQSLEVIDTLNFGVVIEDAALSKDLKIVNTGSLSIEITDIDLFEVYGGSPFSVNDTDFVLFPNDTATVSVSFLPEHNILHEMALVIKTGSGFGHKAVVLVGQGRYSNSYYSSTENKSEEALKTALSTKLAQGYTQLSYSVARDNMYGTIDNVNGDVECVYTGRTATFNTRAGANSNSFNTEHTFPQGFFNQNLPMRSDIHHLFPTDVTANSTRSNHPFGVVSSASWQVGGSKSDGNTFEPRDIHKGTCARAMMYFVIRYQDYANHFSGQETILRQWHNQYAPSLNDKGRNVAVQAVQGNRNPFIDYPQLEERINAFVSNSVAPSVSELYYSDDTVKVLSNTTGRYNYSFVVYNKGNEEVTLDNFSLSDTSLYFDSNFPSSIDILPGETKAIHVSYNSANNYAATLEFDTDISGQGTQIIPVISGPTVGLNDPFNVQVGVYPNPVHDILYLDLNENLIQKVEAYNMLGQVFELANSNKLNMSTLSSGVYYLKVETLDGKVLTGKVIKN